MANNEELLLKAIHENPDETEIRMRYADALAEAIEYGGHVTDEETKADYFARSEFVKAQLRISYLEAAEPLNPELNSLRKIERGTIAERGENWVLEYTDKLTREEQAMLPDWAVDSITFKDGFPYRFELHGLGQASFSAEGQLLDDIDYETAEALEPERLKEIVELMLKTFPTIQSIDCFDITPGQIELLPVQPRIREFGISNYNRFDDLNDNEFTYEYFNKIAEKFPEATKYRDNYFFEDIAFDKEKINFGGINIIEYWGRGGFLLKNKYNLGNIENIRVCYQSSEEYALDKFDDINLKSLIFDIRSTEDISFVLENLSTFISHQFERKNSNLELLAITDTIDYTGFISTYTKFAQDIVETLIKQKTQGNLNNLNYFAIDLSLLSPKKAETIMKDLIACQELKNCTIHVGSRNQKSFDEMRKPDGPVPG